MAVRALRTAVLNRLKTGVMISAAAELGCIASEMPATMRAQARVYADAIGRGFQIRDDMLDVEGDQAVFGKDAGLVDNAEMNRRARTEQRLREALDDPAGIDPMTTEHGWLARSVIGAASTIPETTSPWKAALCTAGLMEWPTGLAITP